MAQSILLHGFSAGELSPNMHARIDLEKYALGAELIRNFYVDFRGGVSNRPGTKFIIEADDNTEGFVRVLPFVFSQTEAYLLVFTPLQVKVYFLGTLVATIVTPWDGTQIWDLKFTQSADVMTIDHPEFNPHDLRRTTLATFDLVEETFGPTVDTPTGLTAVASASGNMRYAYTVTAVDANGQESLQTVPVDVTSPPLDPTSDSPKVVALSWTPVDEAVAYNVYKIGPVPSDKVMTSLMGYIGQTVIPKFTDINIAPDFSRTPPIFRDPFSGGQITNVKVASGGAGYNTFTPCTLGDGTGGSGYIIADSTGSAVGVVILNAGRDNTIASVTPTGPGSGATFTGTVDANHYKPAAVSYFQQRRVHGGSFNAPDLLELSQISSYMNFNYSAALLDSDAITVSVASREVNQIKHFVPMSTGLVVMTNGGAFLVTGGQGEGSPVTPTSISALPQAGTGVGELPPIVVNYNIIFQQAMGSIVRDMTFNFQTQSYYGADRTMLANHLFAGYSLVDWAFAEEPHKLLWALRDDGKAVTMTYVPDQEVFAWARHDTNGLFRSVASVPEGLVSAIYFVVRRYVEGEWRNYVERLMSEPFDCMQDTWFLDSALAHYGTPGSTAITISGTSGQVTITGANAPLMEAKDQLDSALQTIVADEIQAGMGQTYAIEFSQEYASRAYDRLARKLIYSACDMNTNITGTDTNDTGFDLYSGLHTINNTASYDISQYKNWFLFTLDIDTDAVVRYDAWTASSIVPNGIGPSTGSHRRFVEADFYTRQVPMLVDPRTGNVWSHHVVASTGAPFRSCLVYEFRYSESYAQTISPYVPDGDRHLELFGITQNWVYIGDYGKDTAARYTLELLPRVRTSDEITADYLLSYASFEFPSALDSAAIRTAITSDGSLYFLAMNSGTGSARDYLLYKFTQPTSAPFGGPVVGGGFTDETPWTSSTGPNTNAGNYRGWSGSFQNSNIMMYQPAGNILTCITKLLPRQKHPSASTDPLDLAFDCTYVDLDASTFDYHPAFVTGYMTLAWQPTTDPNDAAYAVLDCSEHDLDLAFHDYDFSAVTNYQKRWFSFMVLPVVDGAIVGSYNGAAPFDSASYRVLVEYKFVYGSAPTVTRVVPEKSWDDVYTTYAAAISDTSVVNASMATMTTGGDPNMNYYYDGGVWDAEREAFWYSGQNDNFWKLDSDYTPRSQNSIMTNPPFFKLTLGVSGSILVNCGKIDITGTDANGNLLGDVVVPFAGVLANDPANTVVPILASDWSFSEPISEIAVDHLIGKTVGMVADGSVRAQQVVPANGIVSVDPPASWVVVGLPYQSQLRTLRLEAGELTVQGRRKLVSTVTARVSLTRGLKFGTDFDQDMYEFKDIQVEYDVPQPLFTGDQRINLDSTWNEEGYICIQQDYPLPATVVGLIPEVTFGDNQR